MFGVQVVLGAAILFAICAPLLWPIVLLIKKIMR